MCEPAAFGPLVRAAASRGRNKDGGRGGCSKHRMCRRKKNAKLRPCVRRPPQRMGNSSSQTSKWDDLFQALTKPEDMRAYLEHNSQQDGDRQSTLELQCELLVGTVQVEPTLLKLSEVAESFDTAVFCLGQLVSHEPKTMSELPFARTVVSGLS